jgi:hypothetical protein
MSTTPISPSRIRRSAGVALALALAAAPTASAGEAASLSRVELDGNRITVSARCGSQTRIQLQAGGRRLANDVAACRGGKARIRFTLTRGTVKRLTSTDAPDVQVTVGREQTTVRFSRPRKSAGATASSGAFWSRPRASCNQINYGYPPYSNFWAREVAIDLGGELFGYRVSTPLTARGLFWVYEPSTGRQYWAVNGWTTTYAGMAGRFASFSYTPNGGTWVQPAVQLYNGEWNWVSIGGNTGTLFYSPNWCGFPA